MFLAGSKTDSLSCVAFDAKSRFLIAAGGMMTSIKRRPVDLRELIAWDLPSGNVRWQVYEEADENIADLAVRPGGAELATKCTKHISIWSSEGKFLRRFDNDFLGGPIKFSADGERLVAPHENVVKVRSSGSGRVVAAIPISKSTYTSATAGDFIPETTELVVVASVINSRGNMSGLLLRVDQRTAKVTQSAKLEMVPDDVVVDPLGQWACITGERRNRGWVLFWDLANWRSIVDQGAHGGRVTDLAVSPDATQVATTGTDHVIRLWSVKSFKTISKLDEHKAEGDSGAGLAWSPDGNYLAFAAMGAAPWGGVFLYGRSREEWKLLGSTKPPMTASNAKVDLRPLRLYGGSPMDTFGNFDLLLNQWPAKCSSCTFPDIDATPEPYLLGRGIAAPGEYSAAVLGNFLVRPRARRILEIAVPGACKFFPTYEAKTKQTTDWSLAVPQTIVPTKALPEKVKKCSQCGEPKTMSHLEAIEFDPPAVDIFKSKQWTSSRIGEETPWYLESHLKSTRESVPKGQWTRLNLDRELWMSSRLLLLLKQQKVKGLDYSAALSNRKPTPREAQWIVEKDAEISRLGEPKAAAHPTATDTVAWFKDYLASKSAKKPLATEQDITKWEKANKLKLPRDYVHFVTRVGRHSFADMLGMEGYDVRIVGPKQLDADGYRRDRPEGPAEEAEPDGVLFAVAINGDALCFDVRSGKGDYAIHRFDHETERFEPFAVSFSAAIRRLVEKN